MAIIGELVSYSAQEIEETTFYDLDRTLCDLQSQGKYPVARRGDVWIFEEVEEISHGEECRKDPI